MPVTRSPRGLLTALCALALASTALVCPSRPAAAAEGSYLAELLEAARTRGLHRDPQWLRLGHYRRALLSRYKSQVDGPPFFLAPDGRRDPAAELEATLAAFFAEGPTEPEPDAAAGLNPEPVAPEAQHPQCRFPARYRWLRSALGFDPARLPEHRCPRFQAFRERVGARSATLVFSSYYLNNPSSAFGHTFLRLNKTPHGPGARRLDLMDYGIEYAATVDTRNAVIYAFKGLTGLFKGHWSHWPYYYKVRLYNDFEKRDLWEYDLDLAPEQIEMLVAHLWELGASWFDYYYLSENCSYHILTLLEAAVPSLDLTAHVPWWVIPADTVKALYANPGLVRDVRYRPSIWTQFAHRAAGLDEAETDLLGRLLRDPDAPFPAGLAPERRAAVLDAALDLVDLKYARPILRGDPAAVGRKRRLLERRSETHVTAPDVRVEPPLDKMPQVGHDSFRLGTSSGYSDELGFFQRLDFRFALHDLTDPVAGYPDGAQIEFAATRLRYNAERESVWLEELAVARVVSLSPVTEFDRAMSWKFAFGAKTVRDESCRDCLAGMLGVGVGYTVSLLGSPALAAFAMLETEAIASDELTDEHFRLGVGPSGGVHLRLGRRLSALASASWHHLVSYDPERTYRVELASKLHLSKGLSIGLEGSRTPDAWEGALGVYVYF
jgi:hypothetical protein